MSTHKIDQVSTITLWRTRHCLPFAICQCGWHGKPRVFGRRAIADAHRHAAATNHILAEPLDLWKAARRSRRRGAR